MDDYSSRFRKALNGYDKDDVQDFIQKERDEHARRITELKRTDQHREKLIHDLQERIKEQNKRIAELNDHIVKKDEEQGRLEQDVRDKYEKYIDHYQQIGEILFEAKVRGNKMITDAQSQADQMLSEAQSQADQIVSDAKAEADQYVSSAKAEADRYVSDAKSQAEKIQSEAKARAQQEVDSTQGDIDARLTIGKQKYQAVQDEIREVLDMFNQVQRKFMQSYKDVHEIAESMPLSWNREEPVSHMDADEENEEELEALDDPDDDIDDPDGPKLRNFMLKYSEDDFDPDDDLDDEESRIG